MPEPDMKHIKDISDKIDNVVLRCDGISDFGKMIKSVMPKDPSDLKNGLMDYIIKVFVGEDFYDGVKNDMKSFTDKFTKSYDEYVSKHSKNSQHPGDNSGDEIDDFMYIND